MNDQHVGQLVFLRVYSGTLEAGSGVYNSTKDKKERVGRLLRMHANKKEEVEAIAAGDIAAAIGLKLTTTGDTLCDGDKPIVLESMTFPEPVIAVAIEPKTRADEEKLGTALARLALEDPTFRVTTEEETSQTLIHGMGELHLEIIVDRLLREFRVEANVGKPQVAFRETIRRKGEAAGQVRPADRRPRPVRRRLHRGRAERGRRRLRVREQDRGRLGARASTCRPSRRASRRRCRPASWPATRWWTSRSS